MKTILNVYKPKGLTPLQTINLLRQQKPEYKEKTIGFAGRLDPLAHGVLLLMIDEETTKQRETFLNLPKEYEFEVVFGIATDTYDALGLIVNNEAIEQLSNDFLQRETNNFIKSKHGKQTQTYPPFSSKTVNGKPLFWWAKNNKLATITIPKKEIEIYDCTLLTVKTISKQILEKKIMEQIISVEGDFRQEKIKNMWNTYFKKTKQINWITARFFLSCSSGTYVRSLVNELGENLGVGAITLEILRTKVGEYILADAIKI